MALGANSQRLKATFDWKTGVPEVAACFVGLALATFNYRDAPILSAFTAFAAVARLCMIVHDFRQSLNVILDAPSGQSSITSSSERSLQRGAASRDDLVIMHGQAMASEVAHESDPLLSQLLNNQTREGFRGDRRANAGGGSYGTA